MRSGCGEKARMVRLRDETVALVRSLRKDAGHIGQKRLNLGIGGGGGLAEERKRQMRRLLPYRPCSE